MQVFIISFTFLLPTGFSMMLSAKRVQNFSVVARWGNGKAVVGVLGKRSSNEISSGSGRKLRSLRPIVAVLCLLVLRSFWKDNASGSMAITSS